MLRCVRAPLGSPVCHSATLTHSASSICSGLHHLNTTTTPLLDKAIPPLLPPLQIPLPPPFLSNLTHRRPSSPPAAAVLLPLGAPGESTFDVCEKQSRSAI